VSDSDSPTTPPAAGDHFAARIQAEVVAAAERRRREDVNIARVEREIERAWAHVAPPGAVGPAEELLLDRVDRLSMIDVDAPLGGRPGVKQVKGAIRKGTYWYLRYMSDQLNALHNVHARLLRRMDERLSEVEAASGLDARLATLVSPAVAPGAEIGALLAAHLGAADGPVVVASCGNGECVGALNAAGRSAFGLDADPQAVLAGIDAGYDLRVADAGHEIANAEADSLGAVVIGGGLQRQAVSRLLGLCDAAVAAVGSGGVVAVVPEDAMSRSSVDGELLAGRGLSSAAWLRVFAGAGLEASSHAHGEAGLDAVVIARCS